MADQIGTALASLLAQDFMDWEGVVVDDGSTDGSGEVVSEVADPRIHYYRLPRNLGRGSARQFALERCSGDFIGMLDADDWWYPWKLGQQVQSLDRSPNIGAVCSSLAVEDVAGEVLGIWRVSAPEREEILSPTTSAPKVPISHGAILIRRGIASGVGYSPRLRRSEDRLFLIQALSRAPFRALGEVLYSYRPSDLSSRFDLSTRYWWSARAYSHLVFDYPVSASVGMAKGALQAGVAFSLGCVGFSRRLTRRKPQPPTIREIERHHEAWAIVRKVERRFVRVQD